MWPRATLRRCRSRSGRACDRRSERTHSSPRSTPRTPRAPATRAEASSSRAGSHASRWHSAGKDRCGPQLVTVGAAKDLCLEAGVAHVIDEVAAELRECKEVIPDRDEPIEACAATMVERR